MLSWKERAVREILRGSAEFSTEGSRRRPTAHQAPSRSWGRGASMQPTPRSRGVWVRGRKMAKPAARWPARSNRRWATLWLPERKLRRAFAVAIVNPELTLRRQSCRPSGDASDIGCVAAGSVSFVRLPTPRCRGVWAAYLRPVPGAGRGLTAAAPESLPENPVALSGQFLIG